MEFLDSERMKEFNYKQKKFEYYSKEFEKFYKENRNKNIEDIIRDNQDYKNKSPLFQHRENPVGKRGCFAWGYFVVSCFFVRSW